MFKMAHASCWKFRLSLLLGDRFSKEENKKVREESDSLKGRKKIMCIVENQKWMRDTYWFRQEPCVSHSLLSEGCLTI